VPFYVYNGAALDWQRRCGPDGEPSYTLSDHGGYKHGNDHQFAEQAKVHPWRVHNPADAVLFIIPFLIGCLSRVQRWSSAAPGSRPEARGGSPRSSTP